MAGDLAAEHRDAAKLAEIAGRALLELRADPPALRDVGAAVTIRCSGKHFSAAGQ